MENSNLWVASTIVALRIWPVLLTYAAVVTAGIVGEEYFESSIVGTGILLFSAAMLAMRAHLVALTNVSGTEIRRLNKDAEKDGLSVPFLIRTIGLFVPAVLLAFLFSIGAFALSLSETIANTLILPTIFLAYCLIFGKWGTVLPATLAGDDRSFAKAGQRGRATLSYAFPRLFWAVGGLTAITIVLAVNIFYAAGLDGTLLKDGGLDIPEIGAMAFLQLLGAFQVVMTAVILSRAYLRAEGKTVVTM